MEINCVHLYLLSPLHTGGATQEGNLLGIARESHTNLPYIPSSTIRGRLRASVNDRDLKFRLFGTDLQDSQQLEQGDIWIGDGSLLWVPVPSLSHGVIWVSSPQLLRRWLRLQQQSASLPAPYSCNFKQGSGSVYLKDAILPKENLTDWQGWQAFVPSGAEAIERVMLLPDQHCATIVQMSLWRQVKIKLDENKSVNGGFRYEEAISPDTLMYFSWGMTSQANGSAGQSQSDFQQLLQQNNILQIGGQESLGRGFIQQWS